MHSGSVSGEYELPSTKTGGLQVGSKNQNVDFLKNRSNSFNYVLIIYEIISLNKTV